MGTKGELQYAQKITSFANIGRNKICQKNRNIFAAMMLAQMGLKRFSGFTVAFYSGGLQGPCERHDGL